MPVFKTLLAAFKKYAKFSGRSDRHEFQAMYALWISIDVAYQMLLAYSKSAGGFTHLGSSARLALFLFFFLMMFLFLPIISVGVRRAHDIDRSGWYTLIPFYSLYLLGAKPIEGDNRFGPPAETYH